MATRMQQRRGTAAQWSAANPVLAAGEIGFETDEGRFKIGDGSNPWSDLTYFADLSSIGESIEGYVTLDSVGVADGVASLDEQGNVPINQLGNIIDGAPETLDTLKELADAIDGDPEFFQGVIDLQATVSDLNTGLTDLTTVVTGISTDVGTLETTVGTLETDLGNLTSAVGTSTTDLGNLVETVEGLQGEVSDIAETLSTVSTDLGTLEGTVGTLSTDKAPLASPSFTGTVVLPSDTSIGDVSATEIAHLDGVTSGIQAQIDSKLATSVASTTYAPLAGPTFTGDVVLPSTTSIGTVDSTELGHLNGVTSAIQTQLDAKAPTASPTFTGTVSGITATMVGLGNVDNTADADKPVSTATQTALDAKLSLSGGTMTGRVTLSADPTQALHAVTKQYVDGIEAGLKAKPAVLAATSTNVAGTYDNGTNGVGATLTASSNGSINTVAPSGVSTWVVGSGILLKNQTNKAHNGRYVVTDLGSESTPYVLTRCGLCDEASEIPGAYVFVQDGVHKGTGWVQAVADPSTFVVGTDNIDVFQFSGPGTVTAGSNVSVSGNEVSVVSNPTFANVITASSGVAFSDGTQTKQGVPSISTISGKTDSYTLSNLDERDTIVELNKSTAVTLTIPADSSVNYPVGTTLDIIQTGAGQVTVAGAGGVTVNGTPGLKLRTQWSSATLLKRAANTWLIFGDLTA
jgi:hypothetical protein